MQSFPDATTYKAADCARDVLDVVPLVMQALRGEMRRHRASGLSVPQFRAMGFVRRHAGASLSEVAEHVGLPLPSMSRLIDGLVERRLMTRRPGRGDRRRIHLRLTPRGVGLLAAAHRATQEGLAGTLERLTPQERRLVGIALRCLRRPFLPAAPARRP